MDTKDRFKEAYNLLKQKGNFHTQKEAAEKMSASESNMSRALAGDSRVLTKNFIIRFCSAFDNTVNPEWIINGEGSMMKNDVNGNNNAIGNEASVRVNESEIIEKLLDEMKEQRKSSEEQIGRMLTIIEDLTSKIK